MSCDCKACGEPIEVPEGWSVGPAVRKHYWMHHPERMQRASARPIVEDERFGIGAKLPNGATIIACVMVDDASMQGGQHGAVLTIWHKEYVVWNIDGEANTAGGHYFREIGRATAEYVSRRNDLPPVRKQVVVDGIAIVAEGRPV